MTRASRPPLVRWAILAVIAVVLAWACVRTAALGIFPPQAALTQRLAPGNPEATLDRAIDQVSSGHGRFDEASYARFQAAARALPLDERPFFLLGLRASARRDTSGAIRLLEEAQRRNPRMALTRLLLLVDYVNVGDIASAADEIPALSRLLPGASGALADEMARLAIDPRTRAATRRALAKDPALLNDVLAAMAKQGADPASVMAFAGPAATTGANASGWRQALINARIAAGDYAQAQALWRQAYAIPQSDGGATVYDPGFRKLPGAPPFNWDVTANEIGSAELAHGALAVEYYGRRSGPLASQLLTLVSGRYRIRFSIEGTDGGDGSGLGWTLACAPKPDAPIFTTPNIRIASSRRTVQMEFVVPSAGCGAQWLRLTGTAGEFASPIDARISGLAIERIG